MHAIIKQYLEAYNQPTKLHLDKVIQFIPRHYPTDALKVPILKGKQCGIKISIFDIILDFWRFY